MSKFFNETLKTQNPILPEQGFNLAGLQDIEPQEEQLDSNPVDSDRVQPQVDQTKKIEIPYTSFLATRFDGSDSLHSAAESYSALRTRLLRMRSTRELRSIVITSSSPGEGKTLNSFNLALCCSQLQDMRVLLVDGDIRTGGLSRLMGGSALPGLATILSSEQYRPESAVVETDQPNLYFCAAGSTTQPPPELYASNRWTEFVNWCHESFQLVIVDSPPIMTLADVELMTAACDGVLAVVRARYSRRDMLQKSASQLDSKKFLGLIYNNSDSIHQKYYYGSDNKQ